jgi:outer membrane protein OmpA-like peptidoglycan-associated protein
MYKINLLLAPLFSQLLVACVSWPPQGLGGMAEHHIAEDENEAQQAALGLEHGLRFELDLVRRHLDVLVLEGAELCFPATVVQAKQRENRIARALQGGLEYDGAGDMLIQRQLLARLERQLDYVKQQAVCVLPVSADQETPGDIGKRIFELLNTDNQFAVDSSELNPKYIVRLAEAAQLLRDQPAYHLRITGHADNTGGKKHNHALSLERAKKVGRYLQILGLPAERLQYAAVGAQDPLFEGKEDHIKLVNRRVSVELIESSDTMKQTGSQ